MGQLQPTPSNIDHVVVERSEASPNGERSISPLVAWTIVCALQKYLLTYSDFRRLASGALTIWRPTEK
jgi:hypothetical protein